MQLSFSKNSDTLFDEYNSNRIGNFDEYKRLADSTRPVGILKFAGIAAIFLAGEKSYCNNLQLSKNTDDILITEQYLKFDNFVNIEYSEDYNSIDNEVKTDIFKNIVTDIISFQDLKMNWDGYGAYPLENLSGVNSINILSKLGPEIYNMIDDYYPNPSGTLSISWENKSNLLELEIGNNEFSYYYYYDLIEEKKYYHSITFETENISQLKANISKILA